MHILVQYLASYQSGTSAKTEFVHATTEAADERSIPAEGVIAGLLIIARVTTMTSNTYEWLLCTLNDLVLIKIYELEAIIIPTLQMKTTVGPKG